MAAHGRPSHRLATTGRSSKTVTIAVVVIIAVAVLAITGIAALLRGGDARHDQAGPAPVTGSPTASARGSATESPATPGPTTGAPAAIAAPAVLPVAHTYQGSGNKILKIKKPGPPDGPVLVVATHPGSGSFGVLALDSTMHESDILINVAGSYRGTTLLDALGTQTQHLNVRARGPWTLRIMPVTAARPVDTKAKGSGDAVLRYRGGKGVATFNYRGGLNFVVNYYAESLNAVLVDRIGRYVGQVGIHKGPALIGVKANGAWTMRVTP